MLVKKIREYLDSHSFPDRFKVYEFHEPFFGSTKKYRLTLYSGKMWPIGVVFNERWE